MELPGNKAETRRLEAIQKRHVPPPAILQVLSLEAPCVPLRKSPDYSPDAYGSSFLSAIRMEEFEFYPTFRHKLHIGHKA
jgi:hypothetical protein